MTPTQRAYVLALRRVKALEEENQLLREALRRLEEPPDHPHPEEPEKEKAPA